MVSTVFVIRGISLVLAALFVLGCASNSPYHTKGMTPGNCVETPEDAICKDSYLQDFGNHTIAIAEYSDRGNHFDDGALQNILSLIEEKSDNRGVVTLVFVHGWKHNSCENKGHFVSCKENDKNLVDFKNVIAQIAEDGAISSEEGGNNFKLNGRELVGLYVGWRGKSLIFPKNLTYWERKDAAEQVGNTGLARLIQELDKIDKRKDTNILVTIGHSFGGAAVLSATVKPLISKLKQASGNKNSGCSDVSCGVGDGIFLINPAIEASQVLPLLESTITENYDAKQPPLLVSLSSEADVPNKILFPLGQTAGLLLTSRQGPLKRAYFQDYATKDNLILREEALDSTAVGNFAPFLTHRIDVPDVSEICDAIKAGVNVSTLKLNELPLVRCDDYASASKCGPKRFPRGFDSTPKGAVAVKQSQYNPLYFIRTNKHFMSGHNDIFNEHVVAFLSAQLNKGLTAIANPKIHSNALYHDPEAFKEEYQKALQFSCKIKFLN